MANIIDSIKENSKAPKRMIEGKSEIEQHSLKDQIAAAEFVEKSDASVTKKPWRFMRRARIISPGSQ